MLVEVLLLHRHLSHEQVVAGIAAAPRAGALTADAVALEARKLADREEPDATDLREDAPTAEKQELAPSSLTERRFRTQLRQDSRPLPSVGKYDQLLPSMHSQPNCSEGVDPVSARRRGMTEEVTVASRASGG